MELVDGEWVNRTLSQLCSDLIEHESARSQTSTSLDLSSNAILFGTVTIGIGVAAAPAIRYVGENYIWHPIKWCYHKVANRVTGNYANQMNAEDLLPLDPDPLYRDLIIKLEKSIWNPDDKVG